MRLKQTGVTLATILLLMLLLAGSIQAQGPAGVEIVAAPADAAAQPDLPEEPLGVAGVSAALSDIIPFQGRLTTAGGAPVNGARSIRLALYDVSVGGIALCEDTDTVTVANGLFVFNMNFCSASDTDGSKQLYLGIKVGADAEMTPRQAIYPVPYARSVRPGAVINQTSTTARGLTVQSAGMDAAGAALWVQNTNATGGIGVWSTVAGDDAAIIATNTGTGALFKGFGAGGGEDEFRVNNNGAIETKADSYIFVPGAALVKNLSADTTRWDIQANGAARIWRGATAGGKYVYYPVTLPTQLYGQPVKVKGIAVYYLTSDGTKGFITDTYLRKQTDADSYVDLISDSTDRTSATASVYVLNATTGNVLSTNSGITLLFEFSFADDINWVQIGGIRIQLGHHDLY